MTTKTSKANAPVIFHGLVGRLYAAEQRVSDIVGQLAYAHRLLNDYYEGDTGVSLEITEACLVEAERLLNDPR